MVFTVRAHAASRRYSLECKGPSGALWLHVLSKTGLEDVGPVLLGSQPQAQQYKLYLSPARAPVAALEPRLLQNRPNTGGARGRRTDTRSSKEHDRSALHHSRRLSRSAQGPVPFCATASSRGPVCVATRALPDAKIDDSRPLARAPLTVEFDAEQCTKVVIMSDYDQLLVYGDDLRLEIRASHRCSAQTHFWYFMKI